MRAAWLCLTLSCLTVPRYAPRQTTTWRAPHIIGNSLSEGQQRVRGSRGDWTFRILFPFATAVVAPLLFLKLCVRKCQVEPNQAQTVALDTLSDDDSLHHAFPFLFELRRFEASLEKNMHDLQWESDSDLTSEITLESTDGF